MPLRRDPATWQYPETEPHRVGTLEVGDGHALAFEVSGHPEGKPVVFLHGGPGGSAEPKHRRYFDPEKYRIVLFDQRGCGRSTPKGSLEANTTPHLVGDLERLRAHLGIERWQVFGGSWGSTLALAYAQAHPERVSELVLRGVFLGTAEELAWANGGGVGPLVPADLAAYRGALPPEEQGDLLGGYLKRVLDPDPAVSVPAARAWVAWEGALCGFPAPPEPRPPKPEEAMPDEELLAFARMEAHYFAHGCFLERPLLEGLGRIRHIPAVLVHGRYDLVCPLSAAWALAEAWPELDLVVVPDAGHGANASLSRALVAATDRFAWRA